MENFTSFKTSSSFGTVKDRHNNILSQMLSRQNSDRKSPSLSPTINRKCKCKICVENGKYYNSYCQYSG
jgi:hypothetical protein